MAYVQTIELSSTELYNQDVYYKYTSGESFTLNGLDYVGFFNVDENNLAYTDKLKTEDSLLLTNKSTFLSNIYTEKIELNTTYDNIELPVPYFTNSLDILNKNGIDNITDILNRNNLITIKGLIIDNPNIYDFTPRNNHFYSLSDGSNVMAARNDYVFSKTFKNTSWEFLDNVKTGAIIINSEDKFKYVCSTGTTIHVLSGDFSSKTPLELLSTTNSMDGNIIETIYEIYYDENNNQLFFISNLYIKIYDASNLVDCNKLLLIDKIKIDFGDLDYNSIRPEFIKIGKNLRTEIRSNDLILYNKYIDKEFTRINLSQFKITKLLNIFIRNTDDTVGILHRTDNVLKIIFIDPYNIPTTILNRTLKGINANMDWYKIRFSDVDSDIFTIYHKYECQTRHLSNPKYPSGRLENNDFLYIDRLKWSYAPFKYNELHLKWNYFKYDSGPYETVLVSERYNNNKIYCLLHNKGKLITMYHTADKRYASNTPINLEKTFSSTECSKTSIGPYINMSLLPIIKDIITIYNRSYGGFKFTETGVEDVPFININPQLENFQVNGNETINVITLQKIITNIYDLQNKLISPDSLEKKYIII